MAEDCKHNWVKTAETATTVTHKCSKCHDVYTRPKTRLLAFAVNAAAVLAASLAICCVLGAIFAAAAGVQGP